MRKLVKHYLTIYDIDFFQVSLDLTLRGRLEQLDTALMDPRPTGNYYPEFFTIPKSKEAYKNKIWVTHNNPSADSMASAWVIQKFIDPGARFEFLGDSREEAGNAISFAVPDGDFYHQGCCTFEVLLAAFGLRDKPLDKVAEIVNELDKAGNSPNLLTVGAKTMLSEISKNAGDDRELLAEGVKLFDRLYAALLG